MAAQAPHPPPTHQGCSQRQAPDQQPLQRAVPPNRHTSRGGGGAQAHGGPQGHPGREGWELSAHSAKPPGLAPAS